MRDTLSSERLRAWSGPTWWLLFLIGAPIAALANAGYLMTLEEAGAPVVTDAEATATMIHTWFTASLFAGIFGARLVTSEYTTGAIRRSVLVTGSRRAVLTAKALISLEMGLVYGLLAVAAGAVSGWVVLGPSDYAFTWSTEATLSALGVIVVTAISGPWGVFLGVISRNTAIAIGILVVQALLLDETLFAVVPAVGRFMFTIAQQVIYQDGGTEHLPAWAAYLTVGAWLLVGGYLAQRLFRSRDLG